jgi:phage terminase small subunit
MQSDSSILNIREERFVDEYLATGCGTQAAKKAGYSGKSAKMLAWRLKKRPRVQRAIQVGREAQKQRLEQQADSMVLEYLELLEKAKSFDDHRTTLKILNTLSSRLRIFERYMAEDLVRTMEESPDDQDALLKEAIKLAAQLGRSAELVKLIELKLNSRKETQEDEASEALLELLAE